MYGGAGDQGLGHTGMFAFSQALSGSQPGTRGEMAPLPPGYQDWQYRQPADSSLTSEVSMDAGLSVSSMNPNLNQAVLDVQPMAAAQGWKSIKTEPEIMTPQSERPQALPISTTPKPTQPSPEEYRQYIKKLHQKNLQNHQNTPTMHQSDYQPPSETMASPQEEMAADTSVTVETVVYHQELDELGERLRC